MNKDSQDILNYSCKKIYKLFKPYYVLSYLYDDEEFNIDLGFTKKSQKLLEKKEACKRVIAESIFEELDEKLYLDNSDVKNIIEPCIAEFEKLDVLEILTEKLESLVDEFQVLTKPMKYYDLRAYSFDNLETSKIKNLGLINLFLDILPKEDLEKFKYVIEYTGLKSERNFRTYQKPKLSKLFPNTYSLFFSVIINRFSYFILRHYTSKVSPYAYSPGQDIFQFSTKYKEVFETVENIRILNQYLVVKKNEQQNEYFFNRLLAVLEVFHAFNLKLDTSKLKAFKRLIISDNNNNLSNFAHNRSTFSNKVIDREIKIIQNIIK